ncbi:MAG TPA: hypothetical protein VHV29_06780 [Terriglobales bacterium]|jgi:hypothetical protein|nr:hypothetical protein [Terriglobales bacterium]
MNSTVSRETMPTALPPRFAAPIWTLVLLSPFIAEVLSGSTRTSILFVYVPEVMVWGVGALFCRELARRWRAGGISLLLMGLALSVAEEFIIQQTSLAPLPFPGSHPDYGRMWGVNLVYLLFMLGYESVWVVLVPVQLTELFFPRQAAHSWLRKRGTILACVAFLLGCRIAWYGWTQQARPRMHAAPYHPPLGAIVFGLLTIGLLIALAYLVRGLGRPSPNDQRRTAPAWLAGLTAFVMGFGWFDLIGQNFIAKPVPFWTAIFAGIGWAAVAFTLFVWWSSRQAWGEVHRFAAASGATLACMAAPYMTAASWPKIDLAGEIIFDTLALIGIFLLGKQVFARAGIAKVNTSRE